MREFRANVWSLPITSVPMSTAALKGWVGVVATGEEALLRGRDLQSTCGSVPTCCLWNNGALKNHS